MNSKHEQIDIHKAKSFEINKYDLELACPHIQLHFHDTFEIVYVKKGRGRIRADNHEYVYEDGTVVFIGPNIPHYGLINKEQSRNHEIVIHFDEEFVLKRLKIFPEFDTLVQFILSSQNVLIFDLSFKKVLEPFFEALTMQEDSEQLLSLMRILLKMNKSEQHFSLLPEKERFYHQDAGRLKMILNFINKNFDTKISTSDVANHLNMTVNSFCRLFKRISDKPFMDYLNEFRIHNAVYLIECDGLTISEVMYKSGFSNSSYFTKQFRKYKVLSPSEYRRYYHETIS